MKTNDVLMSECVYNLIILDKSGSMASICNEAIGGVNETVGRIKSQMKRRPQQKQLISLVAFCDCEMKYLYDNVPANLAEMISLKDYQPCCSTPLYDAVGLAICKMDKALADNPLAAVSVTIITDGYENASSEYNLTAVRSLINSHKDKGWLFSYIGADHDVENVSISLSIDHFMSFEKSGKGVKDMFEKRNKAQEEWVEAQHKSFCECASVFENDYKQGVENLKKQRLGINKQYRLNNSID